MENVKVSKQVVTIPTYSVGESCPHPMFLEKRMYQGSSGKVYPYRVAEKISDDKFNVEYTSIFLENEYISVMILPELGGKIQRIFDKTNGYDAVYYNEVIKPALIGLSGPWTAGGIEFSWPQHHRPSSFESVDYCICHNADASVTVWCGEVESMFHIKGMAGFTLYPGKAYLEVKGQIYNPNDTPQTFLWWANPSVTINEHTQTILPPDVHAVVNRNSTEVSKFPVSTSMYSGIDFTAGVDISRCTNIPSPMSYMAYHSGYDFIGNYDYEKQAGLLHIADHQISPGKKQWTWGTEDFGKVWTENLTDTNGAYAEIMAGVFTDNQPGFTYVMPYEEKSFKQYFMPYKNIGAVKNANLDILANLEVKDGKAHILLYAPTEIDIKVMLSGVSAVSYLQETTTVSPKNIYDRIVELDDDEEETSVKLTLRNKNDEILLVYSPLAEYHGKMPKSASKIKAPRDIPSMEELFLAATHLEQYHHPSMRPEEYYLEGLRREPNNIAMNNGYGKLLYKKGLFEEAEKRFRIAIERSSMFNPNPYDCEPYYNLGLALRMQQKYTEAYDAFYKSIWDGKMQDKGYYQLACISARFDNFKKASEFIDMSLMRGTHNMRARTLKTALLRHDGKINEAISFAKRSIRIDPLDFGARYELFLLTRDFKFLNELTTIMHGNLQNYLELSICYASANLLVDASNVLALIAESGKPMLHYYMAYYSNSVVELEVAQNCSKDGSFPNRLQDISVLNYAVENNKNDWFARYSLGNLYYDKGVWFKAINYWRDALAIDENNSFVLRNLAIANYNKLHDSITALKFMECAARYAPDDARIYLELDMLRKLTNCPVKKRLKDMLDHMELVESRDDLYTEYITLLNSEKYYKHAIKAINRHKFHPSEGSEGKITVQYKHAHMGCAREYIIDSDYEEAIKHLEEALSYPENIGEGKPLNAADNDIYFYLGCAYENVDKIESNEYFRKAAEFPLPPLETNSKKTNPDMYYFRAMSFEKLGKKNKALGIYNTLINYCEEHIETNESFSETTLPNFSVFDRNAERENYIKCCFTAALGYTGKGMSDKADEYVHKGLEVDCSHEGLHFLKHRRERAPQEKNDEMSSRNIKWNTSK